MIPMVVIRQRRDWQTRVGLEKGRRAHAPVAPSPLSARKGRNCGDKNAASRADFHRPTTLGTSCLHGPVHQGGT
jgi:hypothetical protein